MKEVDLRLKNDMETLRVLLHTSLSENKKDIDKILMVSQKLDILIARYTEQQIKMAG